jgi:hypothetical protein
MNRKDLKTLSESYERIFENTIADMNGMGDIDPIEGDQPSISIGIDSQQPQGGESCGSEENKTNSMNITKLRSLIAHCNKILQAVEGGKEVMPWMTDKLTVASEHVLDVSDTLEFGN